MQTTAALPPFPPSTACARSLYALRAGRALPLWLFVLRENTALSRGWCTPLTRGSAVCEQNASHNTQILACFPHQLD